MTKEIFEQLLPCQREFFESPIILPITKEAWAYYIKDEDDMPEDAITIDLTCNCAGVRLWAAMSELDDGKISQEYNTTLFLNIFKKARECVIMKTVMRNETFSNNRSGI